MAEDTEVKRNPKKEKGTPLMRAKEALYELQHRRWEKQLQPHKIRRDPEEDIEIAHVGYDAEQMGREK